ncbi:MAG: MFS transporter [Verrucomicrobiales bacterium]|nr:MFS transporter [Verrucomicrobiales bacterium]
MEEKLYELVSGDEDARLCKDITEEACDVVPRNFGKQVISSVCSKIGDQLSKPGLILTWLLTALGAPSAAIGLLVPIREAGSLLPQMMVGGIIRRYSIRKGFWVTGALLQGAAVIAMGFVALHMDGAAAGWSIVGLLTLFSLSRGISSIASKDLLGKTIPKTRRGRLSGLASSISGWLALGVGVFFVINPAKDLPVAWFAALLFFAGGLWIIAAFVMSTLIEKPGATSGGANALKEALASLHFLKDDRIFLRFCIARALLASTVLSMPFYVVLAHGATGGRVASLGLLMIAGSLATALSGVTWGKLSDSSSRLTLAIAGLAAGLIGCLTAALTGIDWGQTASLWLFGALFFLIGLAHTGIRVGRKTYLVDHADSDNRARLVAVSNTLMGIVLLASGSFGLLASAIGERLVILVFALLGIAGAVMAFTLPEAGEGE